MSEIKSNPEAPEENQENKRNNIDSYFAWMNIDDDFEFQITWEKLLRWHRFLLESCQNPFVQSLFSIRNSAVEVARVPLFSV